MTLKRGSYGFVQFDKSADQAVAAFLYYRARTVHTTLGSVPYIRAEPFGLKNTTIAQIIGVKLPIGVSKLTL